MEGRRLSTPRMPMTGDKFYADDSRSSEASTLHLVFPPLAGHFGHRHANERPLFFFRLMGLFLSLSRGSRGALSVVGPFFFFVVFRFFIFSAVKDFYFSWFL